MIGRLDRYVLITFLIAWVVLGVVLLGFFTVLDVIGHADELAEAAEEFGPIAHDVARYYLLNGGFLLVQFAPYLTLLAGLATVLQIGRWREWIPMLVAGRSTLRTTVPMFVGAGLFAAGVVYLREQALPQIVVEREALSRKLFDQQEWELRDAWARSADDDRLRAERFRPESLDLFADGPEIDGLEVFRRDIGGREEVVRADAAVWIGDSWLLENGRLLAANAPEQPLELYRNEDLTPRDLILAHLGRTGPLDLSSSDLQDLLRRDPDNRQAATLVWAWRAAPFGHWLLLLLGLPYTLRLARRSAMDGVARGMIVCLLFFVAEFVLRDLGSRGVVSPFLAGCGPTLLFACLGLFSLDKLPT